MSLRVDLEGNGSGFTQMLNRARQEAGVFSNYISHDINESWGGLTRTIAKGIAGVLTFEGVKGILEGVIGKVEELRQLSDQLGTDDVEKIQKWGKAFEKVGSTIGKAQTLTGQMQEKRQAAMGHDMGAIKTRQQLEGMGFSMAEINPETGLDSLDFMKKAFGFANGSKANANQFEDVFGPKSARFAGAEKYFAGAKAPVDQDMYERLKETSMALTEFKERVQDAGFSLAHTLLGLNIMVDKKQQEAEDAKNRAAQVHRNMNIVRSKIQAGTATQSEKDWMVRALGGQARSSDFGINFTDAVKKAIQDSSTASEQPDNGEHPFLGPPAPTEDADVASQREQWKKEEQDAQLALHRAQEGNMTIGDRRRMITQDMALVQSQMSATQGKLNSKTLGLSGEAFGKMTDIEKDELRHKLTMELTGEQTKQQGLQDELKEKPMDWHGDSMAKVGLFSGASLAFNPQMVVANQQLQCLQIIARNTAKPKGIGDSHTP